MMFRQTVTLLWRLMLDTVAPLELKTLRYRKNCSSFLQRVLFTHEKDLPTASPINMQSGAKSHNVTFHLHLQLCLCLSLMCQSQQLGKYLTLTAAKHLFRPPLPFLFLSFSLWFHGTCLPADDTGEGWQGRQGWPPQRTHHSPQIHVFTVSGAEKKLLHSSRTHAYCINTQRQALLVQRRVTDDHLRASITSHTFAHTHRLGFSKKRVFPLWIETHSTVANWLFDVHTTSWENTASCVCHHQPGQQQQSLEEGLMEEVRGGHRAALSAFLCPH